MSQGLATEEIGGVEESALGSWSSGAHYLTDLSDTVSLYCSCTEGYYRKTNQQVRTQEGVISEHRGLSAFLRLSEGVAP